ncbi:TraY domain-containing protein [Roseicella sp. DB1501]|nr:TraY domain-containing protein [Roseicella sp. DB1501]
MAASVKRKNIAHKSRDIGNTLYYLFDMNDPLVPTSFKAPKSLMALLKASAKKNGRTKGGEIRFILDRALRPGKKD